MPRIVAKGQNLKILVYAHSFTPQVGGVETIVYQLAQGLARVPPSRATPAPEVVVVTKTPAGKMDDDALAFRVVRQPTMIELVRLLRVADILHLSGPVFLPLFLGWLMRKCIIVEHHGFQAACPNGQLFYEPNQSPCSGHFMAGRHRECLRCNAKSGRITSLRMWLLTFPRRLFCKLITANVTPTVWLANTLQLPRTTCIPHGLPMVPIAQLSKDFAAPPTFVFLGRLVGTKGASILIGAAAKLLQQGCTFRVRIIGDGPDREILQQKADLAGLGPFVEFLGYLPDERVEEALGDAIAVVMPSLAGEVFGLVAAERMLRGQLVIASDIGALREVVGDSGLFFPPGDEDALMHCMLQVLEDAPMAAALRRKASERATMLFDRDLMISRHLSIYGGLVHCGE
jgi:glycosyltransferase involved in cell wall biosynthesis